MKHGRRRPAEAWPQRVELGQYVVSDPEICHGKPTFKGPRVMVSQVLDDVADGRSWEFICNVRWGGRIPVAAVAEAVKRSRQTCVDDKGDFHFSPQNANNCSGCFQESTHSLPNAVARHRP